MRAAKSGDSLAVHPPAERVAEVGVKEGDETAKGEYGVEAKAHGRGVSFARRHNSAVYEAMIVAAARFAAYRKLYSEDLRDRRLVDGLRIAEPRR